MESAGYVFRPERRAQPPRHVEPTDDRLELLKLWRIIWAQRVGIVASVFVVGALAAGVAATIKPSYSASATVLVEDKPNKVVSFDPATSATDKNTQFLDTQVELLHSRALAQEVVQKLNLTSDPEFDPRQSSAMRTHVFSAFNAVGLGGVATSVFGEKKPYTEDQLLELVTNRFLDHVSVQSVGKTQLIKVQVNLTDPEKAAQAANALIASYVSQQQSLVLGTSVTATSWMNGRLTELGEQLKASEARLQAYRESEHLVDVKGVSTISAAELSLSSERMVDARRERAAAQAQYQQVESMRAGGWERLLTVPAVLSDPLVQQFKSDQAKARSKVDELSSRYGPRYPAMASAQTELAAATASLRGQIEQVVSGIERNYQLASANEGALNASVNTNKSQIQDISRKEFKLNDLQRDVDTNRALYDTFFTRLKETTATADINTGNTRMVDQAIRPIAPVAPRKSLIIGLAAALALFVSSLIVLGREAMKNTFKSAAHAEGLLRLPVLGIVPLVKSRNRQPLAHLFTDDKHRRFSEAIRTIRTGFMLNNVLEQDGKIVAITSSVPGEGKTTVSINLAFALGQIERVLLIDGDLRRSTLARAFNFPAGTKGLTDLINGSATLAECIQVVNGIDVLCAGSGTSNPLELLASPRFEKALELLKLKYQRVIIDSPPVQAVSDGVVLSSYVDSMIFVVKASTTPIALAEKGIAQLLKHKAPLQGVVMSQVDIKKSSRFDDRFDGYYDYYDYSAIPGKPAINKA